MLPLILTQLAGIAFIGLWMLIGRNSVRSNHSRSLRRKLADRDPHEFASGDPHQASVWNAPQHAALYADERQQNHVR